MIKSVMLVEIPDPEVIFGIIVAFLVGLFAFYAYYKIRPYVNLKKNEPNPDHLERLEYYERQLIDMKIRLDAMEMEELSPETPQNNVEEEEADVELKNNVKMVREEEVLVKNEPIQAQRIPNMPTNNAVEFVLQLITDKSLTSRDIQITLGRSREHTSRLMKKLYEEGYVHRNTTVKPYTYSITEKGKDKIGVIEKSVASA